MKHRDGLRASCPEFVQRVDYWDAHWIRCGLGSLGFKTRDERNMYYKGICCRGGEGCLLEPGEQRKEEKE